MVSSFHVGKLSKGLCGRLWCLGGLLEHEQIAMLVNKALKGQLLGARHEGTFHILQACLQGVGAFSMIDV